MMITEKHNVPYSWAIPIISKVLLTSMHVPHTYNYVLPEEYRNKYLTPT